MSARTRIKYIKYGGEKIGVTYNTGPVFVPSYACAHSCSDETHPGPPYRSGGPLLVKKTSVFIKRFPDYHLTWNFGSGLYYRGGLYVQPYVPTAPTPSSLSGWGAKGYSRTIPTHPIYNLGVSIGELKDLPGMVSQTLRGFQMLRNVPAYAKSFRTVKEFLAHAMTAPKGAGDAYLYGAFGLYPMLQDLLFLIEMKAKLDRKINWLRNHNGKSVRRKVTLQSSSFSENIPRDISRALTFGPGIPTQCYGPGVTQVASFPIRKTYENRIWFSAKYRYWIPELSKPGHDPLTGLKAHLLGLAPDPSIIYKLVPWTWMLDWFTSTGSVLSNLYQMGRYGVVAEYAYVMGRETHTYDAPSDFTLYQGDLGDFIGRGAKYYERKFSGYSTTKIEFRTREVANPYGFGITYPSLSAFQWSILAALGLSRGGKHLAPRP